jgi:hypothetical protein
MNGISELASAKRIKFLESLVKKSSEGLLKWHRTGEDDFEANIENTGFRLFDDGGLTTLYVLKVREDNLSWDRTMTFRVAGFGPTNEYRVDEDKLLNQLWESVVSQFEAVETEEMLELLNSLK